MLHVRRRWLLACAVVAVFGAGIPTAALAASAPPAPGHDLVLYNFAGPNGAGPLSGVTAGASGTLYGTTVFGGKHLDGIVFRLTPSGSGYTETILHTFKGSDGSKPGGNVVANGAGDLFGITVIGGADHAGVAFELVPRGARYVENVIHTFTGGLDGNQPIGTPVIDRAGNIFGVTQFGGTGGEGVVFELSPSDGTYGEHVLYNFAASGAMPQAGLTLARDGSLYGTSYGAGSVDQDGSVFRLRPGKKGYVFTDLYKFKGGTDGSNPYSALTIDNKTGDIYGTTEYGGENDGEGTVFRLTPKGKGFVEQVLHAFSSAQGGLIQAPVLLEANGHLFGTSNIEGKGCGGVGCGTVFELSPSGTKYAFRDVYRFAGPPSDGAEPQWGPLVPEPNGDLIGTTRSGGNSTTCADGGPGGALGCGTVFEVNP